MNTTTRIALLLLGLALTPLLMGCPGMPGAGGGGSQNVSPGLQAPPGMSSGGARTFMGTTITPPDDSYLLVEYSYLTSALAARGQPVPPPSWQSCRRVIFLDNAVIIEGLNYDGRAKEQEKDVNELLPHAGLVSFHWKYEARPAPPAGSAPAPGERPTRRGR